MIKKTFLWACLCALALSASACGGCGTDDPNPNDTPTPNQAPQAAIEAPEQVEVGQQVELSAAGSQDADGDALSFTWTLATPSGSEAELDDPGASAPTFEADVAGDYAVTLVVSDGTDPSEPAEATVTAVAPDEPEPDNQAPVADAGADQTVELDARVELDGTGSSDPDEDPIAFSWEITTSPEGAAATLSDPGAPAPSFVPDVAGVWELTLEVTDGELTGTDAVVVTVEQGPTNQAPVADAGAAQQITLGDSVTLDGSASSDPDGDALDYDWNIVTSPQGADDELDDPSAAQPTFTPGAAGAYVVELTVTDPLGEADTDSVMVTVDAPPNADPVADAGPHQTITVGEQVTLDGTGSTDAEDDAAGGALTYAWALTTLPAGSAAGLDDPSSPTPSFQADVAGVYVLTLTVTDADGGQDMDTVQVTAQPLPNDPPVAEAGPNQTVEAGDLVTLDGSGSTDLEDDAANTALTYAWSINSEPTGSSVTLSDASATTPTFVPLVGGDYVFSLEVTDAGGLTDTDTVTVTVTNAAPVADAGADQAANVNELVALDGAGSTDAEDGAAGVGLAYKWTVLDEPAGSSVTLTDDTSAQASFTPAEIGTYTLELRVTDSGGATDTDTVAVTISAANNAPVADAGPDQAVTVNDLVTLDATGSTDVEDDATSTPLVLSWAVVNEPAGSSVTLSDASAATPTCTPAVAGSYTFELTVTDSVGDSTTDAVTISVNAPPTADAGADQSVTVNATVTLDGSGSTDAEDDAAGMALDYSWALTAQPSGASVTLSDASAVAPTFTPTVDGTYVFELMVLDSDGATDADVVTITVNTDNPPVADAGADQGAAVGDMVTLDGSNSSDVEDDAAGVALTYSWAVTAEPAGSSVTLSDTSAATPTCTPAVAGSYTFELTVTDSDGNAVIDGVTVVASAVAPAQNCLIISEVLEGSSSNKAVELFNKCQADSVELTSYHLCLISNSNTDCGTTLDLSGTLTAGQTYQICDGSLDTSLLLAGVSCDVTSGVTNFNGNDRLLLSFDDDGTPGYSTGDTRVDAFGQTDTDPGAIWADAGYSRCDFTEYDGTGAFSVTDYFLEDTTQDDFSGFGIAPAEGCSVANNAPVADAGADQSVDVGEQVTLDGLGSTDVEDDAAGVALTYSWAVIAEPTGSSVVLSDASAVMPTFTPAVAGSYTFELTVTDSVGDSTTDTVIVTVTVNAVAPPSNCLIISEVMEGSSSNKAVELYNKCQAETVDLSQYNLCLISNSNTDCNTTLGLSGTLVAGQTYQICNGSLDANLLPAGVSCDETSGVTSFNGNDRLLLTQDDDGTPGYSTGDTRIDAFGQTDTDPGSVWANAGYSRCDFTEYDGTGPFTVTDYFLEDTTQDDFSGFGVAPVEGCP